MRIDKFLKVSRIIKRRSVAQEACEGHRIEVNGSQAKPSKDVNVGDVVSVRFGDKTVTFRILNINETAGKTDAADMYEILGD
jgi:Ribosome-associated heat shock protein implicated in the recycling of the 50S subunit (S4 paralog)